MLEAVYSSATGALRSIRTIQQLIVDTEARARRETKRVNSKEVTELILRLPNTLIASLESVGIAKRGKASVYLRETQRIGIVDGIKVGRDVLFVNRAYLAALIE